jgi:hypothetical protein
MSEAGWYYAVDGQRMGPVPLEQLRRVASGGQLGADDLVWTQGMADWQPAATIPGLMPPPMAHGPQLGGQRQGPPPPPAAAPNYGGGQPLPYQGHGGHPGSYYGYQPVGQSYQGMAIAGFVLSFLFSLLGLIFSWVALNGMKRTGNNQGKGLATAGMIISIVMIAGSCMCIGLGGLLENL